MSAPPRNSFADRLLEVCVDLKLPTGRGRDSALARMLNLTPNAVRKWFNGDGTPELKRAVEIARLAHVNVIWLLQGEGPKRLPAHSGTVAERVHEAIDALPPDAQSEVLDYVRYKVERYASPEARERLAPYLVDHA